MRLNMPAKQSEQQFEDKEIDWKQVDLPKWVEARINWQQEKEAKSGGRYLSVAFRFTEGELAGVSVFGMFTTSNKNATAVTIGHEQIGEMMWSCGLSQGSDSDQLVGKTLRVRLVGEDNEYYGFQARPVGFAPAGRNGQQQGFKPRQGGATDTRGLDTGMPTDPSPPVDAYADDSSIPF